MKKIELYKTAHAAAELTLTITSQFDLDAAAPEAFKAAGHDKADYNEWKRLFGERRAEMVLLASTPTDSQLAADKLAATKGN